MLGLGRRRRDTLRLTIEEVGVLALLVATINPDTLDGADADEGRALIFRCRAAIRDDTIRYVSVIP